MKGGGSREEGAGHRDKGSEEGRLDKARREMPPKRPHASHNKSWSMPVARVAVSGSDSNSDDAPRTVVVGTAPAQESAQEQG